MALARVAFAYAKGWLALIKSIKHKGLRRFHASGGADTRGISHEHRDRLIDLLAALDTSAHLRDLDIPGWHLHALKGKDRGRHSVRVSANWRLTFEFANGDAYLVDYEDYH